MFEEQRIVAGERVDYAALAGDLTSTTFSFAWSEIGRDG
jgi:hypothetical protein